MHPRPINCNWPDCSTYDENCMVGINMPCVIEGEKLRAERLAANRGCAVSPSNFIQGCIVVALLAAGFAIAWNVMPIQGLPV